MNYRFFILGLDGGTWEVLDPMIKNGFLPNLKRIKAQSSYGQLISCYPPMTPPAWASFMTGCNPGKHGIFGFTKKDPDGHTYMQYPVNKLDIKKDIIFEYMSRMGKKVISINVPMTFPVSKINGIMISGMMTPNKGSDYCYPNNLEKELKKHRINYKIDIEANRYFHKLYKRNYFKKLINNGAIKLINDLSDVTRERFKTTEYLIKNKKWDLMMVVFVGMDRIQHFLWEYLPLTNKKLNNATSKNILRYYRELDNYIGKIFKTLSCYEDVLTVIISDHGFGEYKGDLYLNNWLKEKGYLSASDDVRKKLIIQAKKYLKNIGITGKTIRKYIKKNKADNISMISSGIDWSKSKAYVSSVNGININLKGREIEGSVSKEEYEKIRSELKERLLELEDKNKQRILKNVFKKEEIYSGKMIDEAPDLIVEFKKDHLYHIYQKNFRELEFKNIFSKSHWKKGDHTMNGMCLFHGKIFKKNFKVNDANIIDIFPNILYSIKMNIPDYIDGKVINEIYIDSFLNKNPVHFYTKKASKEKRCYILTEKEKKELEEKLKSLGYL